MRAVQVLDEVAEDLGFLVREIYEFLDILERGRHLDEPVHVPVDLLHGEADLLESVDVSINGAVGRLQLLGQFVDGEIDVAGHQAHEAQDSFYSWLFHMVSLFLFIAGYDLSQRSIRDPIGAESGGNGGAKDGELFGNDRFLHDVFKKYESETGPEDDRILHGRAQLLLFRLLVLDEQAISGEALPNHVYVPIPRGDEFSFAQFLELLHDSVQKGRVIPVCIE